VIARGTHGLAAVAGLAALLLVGCADDSQRYDFARCEKREVAMTGKAVKLYDCPVTPALNGVDGLRYIEMGDQIANVIALSGRNAVTVVPDSLGPWIVGYGTQRFGKLTVHLPPQADPAPWTKGGWVLNAAGSTGSRAVWDKPA
jgi:hypothetical protein